MKRKVALLKSRSYQIGGLEKYASRIADAFQKKGDDVSLLTTGIPLPSSPFSVYATQTIPWPAFLRMEQFDRFVAKWLKEHKPDLVFGMDRNRHQTHIRAGNGVHAAYLESRARIEGAYKVWLSRYNPLHRKILELEKSAFENPSLQKLFANSYMVRRQLLEHYRIDPAKIEVVHNGVEWEEMALDFSLWPQKRKEGLEQFQLDPNLFHFLFIGHGYLRKGLTPLLHSLSFLKNAPFHLSIIGKDSKLPFFQKQVEELGLKKKVRFFGPSKEIRLFYQLADALVIPSFYDPFANVTVEALAMGLYVVSSKQNGGHEILTSENGVIIEDLSDPDAFVFALQKAMEHPKTWIQSRTIRESVQKLDFSLQLNSLIKSCG